MDEFQRTEQPDGALNVSAYATGYPDIVAVLKPFRAQDVIAAVGGLLTVADLQANCFRLEVLAQLAAAFFCRGGVVPAAGAIKSLFDSIIRLGVQSLVPREIGVKLNSLLAGLEALRARAGGQTAKDFDRK